MSIPEIRINLTRHYYRICAAQVSAYQTLDANLRKPTPSRLSPAKIKAALYEKEQQYENREQCAVIGIAFAGMCLEAFFYDYAASRLGDTYTKEHLDKLDLPSKLLIVPSLVCGESIDKSSDVFAKVKRLSKDRNCLVHFKSKRFDASDLKSADGFHAQLNTKFRAALGNGIDAIQAVMKALDKLHGTPDQYFKRVCT